MTTTTRTHGRCAVQECTNPGRRAQARAEGRWHLIDGAVYSQERRTFVVHSWAEACDEHRDTVATAVQADVDGSRDRWQVHVGTYDYGTPDTGGNETVAHGIGTAHNRLF